MEHLFDSLDRSDLQQFEGQLVAFTGRVQNVISPDKDTKLICLQKVRIAQINNDVLFKDRDQLRFDHIWLNVSDITHVKHSMYDEVLGCATVKPYKRKDGSKAFGLVFIEKGFTETGYHDSVIDFITSIERATLPVKTKADYVKRMIDGFKKLILEQKVILFETTAMAELKRLDDYSGVFMSAAGCPVTLNREGLRSMRKPRHRKPALSVKRGFA